MVLGVSQTMNDIYVVPGVAVCPESCPVTLTAPAARLRKCACCTVHAGPGAHPSGIPARIGGMARWRHTGTAPECRGGGRGAGRSTGPKVNRAEVNRVPGEPEGGDATH